MTQIHCKFCNKAAQERLIETPGNTLADDYEVSCSACGLYIINRTAKASQLEKSNLAYLISGFIRENHENGLQPIRINEYNLNSLLDSIQPPNDPIDAIDRLLLYINRKSTGFNVNVPLQPDNDYPITYSKSPKEFIYLIQKAVELGLIESNHRLSIKGWDHLLKIRTRERKFDQAFVAMWFNPILESAWKEGFYPALKDTGYKPIRVDLVEHNEKICDRIFAEIRKSGLMVADFTGQRGGVYFEAGFAMGLGLPVIRTCREDDIKNLHFDTRQYNHIVWNSTEDLRMKLKDRIDATCPIRKSSV